MRYSECNPGGAGVDRAKCVGQITLPVDTVPGVYSMLWFWEFNKGEFYNTCFDITVVAPGQKARPAATIPTPPPPSPGDGDGDDGGTNLDDGPGCCSHGNFAECSGADSYCDANRANCEGNCNGRFLLDSARGEAPTQPQNAPQPATPPPPPQQQPPAGNTALAPPPSPASGDAALLWDGSFVPFSSSGGGGKDFCSCTFGSQDCSYICAGGGSGSSGGNCERAACESGQYSFNAAANTWRIEVAGAAARSVVPYRAFAYLPFCKGQPMASCGWAAGVEKVLTFQLRADGAADWAAYVKLLFWTDSGNILGMLGPKAAGSTAEGSGSVWLVAFPNGDYPNGWAASMPIVDGRNYAVQVTFKPLGGSNMLVSIHIDGVPLHTASIPTNALVDSNGPQLGVYSFDHGVPIGQQNQLTVTLGHVLLRNPGPTTYYTGGVVTKTSGADDSASDTVVVVTKTGVAPSSSSDGDGSDANLAPNSDGTDAGTDTKKKGMSGAGTAFLLLWLLTSFGFVGYVLHRKKLDEMIEKGGARTHQPNQQLGSSYVQNAPQDQHANPSFNPAPSHQRTPPPRPVAAPRQQPGGSTNI